MFTHWGLPIDGASWCALVLALALLSMRRERFLELLSYARATPFMWSVAAAAGCLSALYVSVYLGGAPRIIDATSYFLLAKLEAAGHFGFSPVGPTASFNGRFLVTAPDGQLGPLFPPGYPSILALFVWLGKAMWLGPVLAALIAALTYRLGHLWFGNEAVARLGALFSVFSAALRYQTADTMSHGWAALLFLVAVYCCTDDRLWMRGVCGLAIGWLCATRPVTGMLSLLVVGFVWRTEPRSQVSGEPTTPASMPSYLPVLVLVLGLVPGLLLLGLQQKVMTGSWFESLQYAYYARGDYPTGCFRYGFGSNVGCRFEHGSFVEQYMPQGYGWLEAAGTTGRRLAAHLCDPGNLEVLALALPLWMGLGRQVPAVQRLSLIIVGQVLAYIPFYFDGNYPGAGARFYADVLPFEHLLLAWGVWRLRLPQLGLGLSLAGFALHTVHRHVELRERDGGAPMFDERLVKQRGIERGLIFVDTDHGFNLGFEPDAAEDGLVVARYRGDGSDALLYQHLHSPPSYRYIFDISGKHETRIEPYVPNFTPQLNADSLWPPRASRGGSTFPALTRCGTGGGLTLLPDQTSMEAEVDLWIPERGHYALSWIADGPVQVSGALGVTHHLEGECVRTSLLPMELDPGAIPFRLRVERRTTLGTVEVRAFDGQK